MSYSPPSPGTLYLVSTPIGNLEDMTLRGLRILKKVNRIACEDTRQTQKLLSHFGISKPLLSYYAPKEEYLAEKILHFLQEGESVALVTDAGTPCISDPGGFLVSKAIEREISVIPIPGPSACLTALVASGWMIDHFYFHGFLPLKDGKRKKLLESLFTFETILIFYESGKRIRRLVKLLEKIANEKPIIIGRELTKHFEEFRRGMPSEVLSEIPEEGLKGECVLLIDGRTKTKSSKLREE